MKKVIFGIGITILCWACKKESSVQRMDPSQVDVYLAGWVSDTDQYAPVITPTYWKNGEPVQLNYDYTMPDGYNKEGWANSIAVSGNNIYVAGHRKEYNYFGRDFTQGLFWKNGTASEYDGDAQLQGYNQYGQIVISNNDVYSVVRQYFGVGNTAQYLKNDNLVSLDQGAGPEGSLSYGIAVSGNDVYVAGAAIKISLEPGPGVLGKAQYWKNGTPVDLVYDQASAFATAIAVSGSDVYAAGTILNGLFNPDGSGYPGNGYTNRRGIYWKNGVPSYLTDGTTDVSINGIVISANDVFIVGTETDVNGKSNAKYWKNGVAISLTDGSVSGEANSIAVVGTDVYVAGLVYDGNPYSNGLPRPVAAYWKNGELVKVSDGTTDAGANSIFLAPR